MSHQWLSHTHPDPQGQHAAVLRATLQGVLDGNFEAAVVMFLFLAGVLGGLSTYAIYFHVSFVTGLWNDLKQILGETGDRR